MKIRKGTPSTELMLLKKVFYRPAQFYHPRLIDQIQTQTVLTYNFFLKKKKYALKNITYSIRCNRRLSSIYQDFLKN